MTGYRDSTSYDPYAYERPGPVTRPYNWVQWTGVAIGTLGIALGLLHIAIEWGWVRTLPDPGSGFISLAFIGSTLVISRRESSPDGVVRTTSRRTLIAIALGLVAFAIGLTAVIYFQGAK